MSASDRKDGAQETTFLQALFHGRTIFSILMFSIFAGMVLVASTYSWPANFLPYVIGFPGMALTLMQIVIDIRAFHHVQGKVDPRTDFEKYMDEIAKHTGGRQLDLDIARERVERIVEDPSIEARSRNRREIILFGYFFFLLGLVLLFGFWIGTPIFLFLFLRYYAKESLKLSILVTAGVWAVMYGILVIALEQIIWEGFVTNYIYDTYLSD